MDQLSLRPFFKFLLCFELTRPYQIDTKITLSPASGIYIATVISSLILF